MTNHGDGFPLGNVSVDGPICLDCDETKLYIGEGYGNPRRGRTPSATAQSLDIDLSNFTIAIQGIVVIIPV
jgi:hypothetical protein